MPYYIFLKNNLWERLLKTKFFVFTHVVTISGSHFFYTLKLQSSIILLHLGKKLLKHFLQYRSADNEFFSAFIHLKMSLFYYHFWEILSVDIGF